jgi:biotin transport system ATP-binding protein
VLDGLSLTFGAGEVTVIAGMNGAGKTLFAKCLAGLLIPDSGRVRFEGSDMRELKGSPATRVAYLYQDARLQILGDSVLDDVRFGLYATGVEPAVAEARAHQALESVGLAERVDEIPYRLSGGEQRRLAIASVLVLEPAVLILDEPFANLDWASVAAVLSILIALKKRGRSLVILTHELEKILGLADRLVVLDAGRIALEGPPEDVLRSGVEAHGLRDPFRRAATASELLWLGS